jgi:hypothetical protein
MDVDVAHNRTMQPDVLLHVPHVSQDFPPEAALTDAW